MNYELVSIFAKLLSVDDLVMLFLTAKSEFDNIDILDILSERFSVCKIDSFTEFLSNYDSNYLSARCFRRYPIQECIIRAISEDNSSVIQEGIKYSKLTEDEYYEQIAWAWLYYPYPLVEIPKMLLAKNICKLLVADETWESISSTIYDVLDKLDKNLNYESCQLIIEIIKQQTIQDLNEVINDNKPLFVTFATTGYIYMKQRQDDRIYTMLSEFFSESLDQLYADCPVYVTLMSNNLEFVTNSGFICREPEIDEFLDTNSPIYQYCTGKIDLQTALDQQKILDDEEIEQMKQYLTENL